MNPRASRFFVAQLRLLIVAALAAMVLGTFVHPSSALADENVAYVQDSEGNKTYYTDKDEARRAAYGKGKSLVLLTDWELGTTMGIDSGKELTIDMNGHKVANTGSGDVFYLYENASLSLKSSKPKTTFEYKGYFTDDLNFGEERTLDVVSGGLITGGTGELGGAIHLESGCHLTLDAVAVAGNRSIGNGWSGAQGGGIYAEKNCSIKLSNGATVRNNSANAGKGGGIYLEGDNTTVSMESSANIHNNWAQYGGGIYSNGSNHTISLNTNASIDQNGSGAGGGGVYLNQSKFTLISDDKTGEISYNRADHDNKIMSRSSSQSGGGISVDQKSGENSGLIKGLRIDDNYANYDGGGIELDQESTTISECKIVNNRAEMDGGGIYVNNDKCIIDNSTIMYNHCNYLRKSYEGGGVFVGYRYDIAMTGVCTIQKNSRRDWSAEQGSADDVFLSTISGQTGAAYITGSLSSGSKVGIRTGITEDRMIAKDFSCASKDCFFMNLDGYYASYGTDHNGDAWQRHSSTEFAVKINGTEVGSYKEKESVSISGDSEDADKVFWYWDCDNTTGLVPVKQFIKDENLYESGLTFTMPQNVVNLAAVYADRVSAGQLIVTAPVAGEELSSEGTFKRTDGGVGGTEDGISVKVAWYQVYADGSEKQVSGTVKSGTTYRARAWVDDDAKAGWNFGNSKGTTVMVKSAGGDEAAAIEVETRSDGSLYVKTDTFETVKSTVTSVDTVYVTVREGTSEAAFRNALPKWVAAKTDADATVKVDLQAIEGDLDGLVKDGVVVKPQSGTVTVYIPISSDEVTIPSGLNKATVKVTVTSGAATIDTPTVDVPAGRYSLAENPEKFDNGKLKITASCTTLGATIKYRLNRLVDGAWVSGDEQECDDTRAVLLDSDSTEERMYELEIWAEKDEVPSAHASFFYVVNGVEMRTVTVNETDTGVNPSSVKLKDYEVQKGSSITIEARERKGYVFEKWVVGDDEYTTAALTFDSVKENKTVTAVYNPLVSEFDLDFAAPVAHETMATSGTVKAKAGDSDTAFDISEYFKGEDGKASVAWSPEGDADGKAGHETVYTAALTLKSSVANSTTVKYVLDENVVIKYAGNPIIDGSAYIAKAADGTRSLCLEFPTTGPWENPELDDLSDVELSFEDAWDFQTIQDAGKDANWNLPKRISVTCACGETVALDIEWDEVTGFDKTKLEAQEFQAKGTITFPDYIDPEDAEGNPVSNEVAVTVKVAAPETVPAPTASIESGTYAGVQKVELDCQVDDATIYYTIDGTEPDENSLVYDGEPIEVAHSTVIKAKAYRDAMVASGTSTFTYTITHKVSFDSAGGSAVKAQTVKDGEAAVEPTAPTREGYEFLGWMLDGKAYDFSTPVKGDLALKASWNKKDGGSDDQPDGDSDDKRGDGSDDQPDDKKSDGDQSGKGEKNGAADDKPASNSGSGAKRRASLPRTGDLSAVAGVVAAVGMALAACGVRFRCKR